MLLEGVTGNKDLMTNSVGIAAAACQTLGGDCAERLVRSYLGTAPEWQQLADVREGVEGEAPESSPGPETRVPAVLRRTMGVRLSPGPAACEVVGARAGNHDLGCDARPVVEM